MYYEGQDFKSITSEGLVLVDFFATWCGPCKMLMPVLERVEPKLDFAKIYKIDIDKYRNLAIDAQVRSIPTLVLFKDGVEVDRHVGPLDEDAIINWLTQFK